MVSAEENERLTRVGAGTPCGELMRRYWHPVAASSQLPEPGTRPVRILGEDLVLYRDRQGGTGLVQPHCAHRRAGLMFGMPDERGLRCTYHGWLYDATGQCLEQPYEAFIGGHSEFHDRIKIKAYPTEELGGLIFAYLGPAPRPLVPRWRAMVDENMVREIGVTVLPCNWLQAVENVGDASHVVYSHWYYSQYVFEKLGRPGLQRTAGGTSFNRIEEQQPGPFGFGHILFPYIDIQYDAYQIRVPIDDTHTMHYWYMFYPSDDRQLEGVDVPTQRDSTDIPFFTVPVPAVTETGDLPWELMDNNSGQDLSMWYSQGPIMDRAQEHLGVGDASIVGIRKYLEQQISIAEDGGDPVNVFRDPAANQCLEPEPGFRRGNWTPEGRLDLMTAVRKYSPWLRASMVRLEGEQALAEPVH